jgi:hypothetical protein|tara:strand:+ start:1528 stop:1722 length:195 start_codon:yes stop_codon:yes gene_type:complete
MIKLKKKKEKKTRSLSIIVLDLLSSKLITKKEAGILLDQGNRVPFSGWCTTSTYNLKNIHYENK